MTPLLFFVPLILAFEVWQLVISERYLGIDQIEREVDPRTLGPGEMTAFFWSLGILLSWAWMATLLFYRLGRLQAILMIVITLSGYVLRRSCGLKWVLVVLTFEGALRVGMLISLVGMALRQR